MKNGMIAPSEFLTIEGIEYFLFEEEFMEGNIRCIPMVVRFKMDKAGVKLKLSEWSKFSAGERIKLAQMPCYYDDEISRYTTYLTDLVKKHTGQTPITLSVEQNPLWSAVDTIPGVLVERLNEFGWQLSVEKWSSLTNLQRFALLKLCRPNHENRNFPKAVKEFCLLD